MYSYICECELFAKKNEAIDDQRSAEAARFLTPREDIVVEQKKPEDHTVIIARYLPSNQNVMNQLQSILFSPFQILLWPSGSGFGVLRRISYS